jgi:hypothetical protein
VVFVDKEGLGKGVSSISGGGISDKCVLMDISLK